MKNIFTYGPNNSGENDSHNSLETDASIPRTRENNS